MSGEYSFYERLPRNFAVDKRRRRIWRRWEHEYRQSREFRLLKDLEQQQQERAAASSGSDQNLYWLLPYRAKFRVVISKNKALIPGGDADAIRYYLSFCPQPMIPIGVCLLSHCADRFRLYGIWEFRTHPSPQVRKHVAKALRRLEAWVLLDEMAAQNPRDSKIQWYARSPVAHRPFAERLSNFVQSVDDSHAGEVATPSRMPFWAAERTWEYTPPKSVELMRRLLRRIRHWVRWGVS